MPASVPAPTVPASAGPVPTVPAPVAVPGPTVPVAVPVPVPDAVREAWYLEGSAPLLAMPQRPPWVAGEHLVRVRVRGWGRG